jgi:hypothetical protein
VAAVARAAEAARAAGALTIARAIGGGTTMYKFRDGFETDDSQIAAAHAAATGQRAGWSKAAPAPKAK